jgi:argininosuccinate synthase
MPGIKVIAPWREWDLLSREKLLAYAEKHGIPVEMKHKQGGSPYSMDANLLHISYEGRHLEDPRRGRRVDVALDGVARRRRRRQAEYIDLDLREGRPGRHQRQPHEARTKCSPSSTSWAASTASAASTWSRTATSA